MKFERDEGSFEISLCVCSIRVFTKFLGDPYYEPLAWFMMKSPKKLKILEADIGIYNHHSAQCWEH